ncbi:hypothetical protein AB834_00190 [PVC group bacterium (ex Bugula neritina AB1)]|nr:hypothetical protein AB834_00190 [PVC group bacterium (ex Bugula neritina AB1)]
MKKVAIMTSGGDSPGMNAAVRAAVRTALHKGIEPWGIFKGYDGCIDNNMELMSHLSVSNIIHRGGTILKTCRSDRFRKIEGVQRAAKNLEDRNIDALVAIGGDGTMRGLVDLQKYWSGKVIALPGTIDNDLYGTDATIGYDTAVNTAMTAIDQIRDTANAHDCQFIVEVMGRYSGHIALMAALAGGAEEVLIPEINSDVTKLYSKMETLSAKEKYSYIVVIAEGDEAGSAFDLASDLKKRFGVSYKVTVLGHIQRGGSPSVSDRILASKLGNYAIETLQKGSNGVMIGEVKGDFVHTPIEQAFKVKKQAPLLLYDLVEVLS